MGQASPTIGETSIAYLLALEDGEERRDDLRIELLRTGAQQLRDRVRRIEMRPMMTILRHRIVRVGHGDDAARERNRRSRQLQRVAIAAEPLVRRVHDRSGLGERAGGRQDFGADVDMLPHDGGLAGGERRWLPDERFRYRRLA